MLPDALTISTLESVLRQEVGLNISSLGKNSIKKALTRRMKSLSITNFYGYLSLIKKSTKELNSFIDEVAINETWFYRDEAPFATLSSFCLSCLKKNPEEKVRLLSIPCSTGEEPYSMAISLIEAGFNENQYIIDAIDISTRSLTVARNGVYKKNSFRGHSTRFQKQYFNAASNKTFQIKNHVKTNINFLKGNLLNLNLPLQSHVYDVIFCRNLLIYLDANFHPKVISTLHSLLKDDGLLFIGHSEAGLFAESPFAPAPYPKTFSFFKRKNYDHNILLTNDSKDTATQSTTVSTDNNIDNSFNAVPTQNESLSISEAQLFVNEGEFSKAIDIYERIIQNKGPSAKIFYLLGSILFEIKEYENSIKILKKAIYLDPNFIEAINLISKIYKDIGDTENFARFTRRSKRVQHRLSKNMTYEGLE